MNKLLTILTVCKNSEETIGDCLRSSIDYDDVEHLVIDGNSSDKTVSIVRDLIIERPHISLFQENEAKGIYSALNLGFSLAKGKYIIILNSDDQLVNFSSLYNAIKFTNADIVVGRQLGVIGKNSLVTIGYRFPASLPLIKMPWPHGSMIVKKDFFDLIGNYSTTYRLSSDLDWVNKALNTSPNIEYLDYNISKFVFGGVSTTSLYGPVESFLIFRSYGGSATKGILNLIKAITIKVMAKIIGWENIFRLKKILKLRTGIWHS